MPLAYQTKREMEGIRGADLLKDMNVWMNNDPLTGKQREIEKLTMQAELLETAKGSGVAVGNALAGLETRIEFAGDNAFTRYMAKGLAAIQNVDVGEGMARVIEEGVRRGQSGGSLAPREAPGDVRVGQ